MGIDYSKSVIIDESEVDDEAGKSVSQANIDVLAIMLYDIKTLQCVLRKFFRIFSYCLSLIGRN